MPGIYATVEEGYETVESVARSTVRSGKTRLTTAGSGKWIWPRLD